MDEETTFDIMSCDVDQVTRIARVECRDRRSKE